jgi:ferric-dicitrate binding protein FerR (iron transport regulator)
MSYPSPRIRELIIRFLKKEASDIELTEVQKWLRSDSENIRYFDEINALFQEELVLNTFDKSKIRNAWQRIEARIENETGEQTFTPRIFRYRILQVAAAVSLLAIAFWFLRSNPLLIDKSENIVVLNSTASTMHITLPDSTSVWLNVSSSIEYNPDFNDHRSVQLKGEAFFDVKKKNKQSFIVQTPRFSIQVKGTRFNVQAYESRVKKATLEEGEIELTIHGSTEKYAMAPGDQILIDSAEQTIIRKKVNPETFTAWKEPGLVFDNTSLAEIVTKLENRFQVHIVIEDMIAQRERFSMNIEDESIEDILEMIHLASNLNYKIENKTIVIYE